MSLIRALLPSFRNQKSGYILNVSSVAGIAGGPAFGAYNASKAALEAASEALAAETALYNIKVLIIVPGYFPTGFLSATATASNPADTRPTVYTEPSQGYDVVRRIPVAHIKDRQLGDAEKAALRIYEAVATDPNGLVQAQLQKTPWVRIQVGSDSALRIDGKLALLKANIELMRPISEATDMDEEQVERFAAEFAKQQAA
jgi:NAD(P)-dependent dehydrogenase (short-subunit alcohol dehydrogenase family)